MKEYDKKRNRWCEKFEFLHVAYSGWAQTLDMLEREELMLDAAKNFWRSMKGQDRKAVLCISFLVLVSLGLLGGKEVSGRWVAVAGGEWTLSRNSSPFSVERSDICEMFKPGFRGTLAVSSVWHSSNYFPNLFQTADLNDGVRFELHPLGEIAGLIVASDEPEGFSVFSVERGDDDVLSVVYRVEAGSIVIVQPGKDPLRLPRKEVIPVCSNFVIGAGFDGSRIWMESGTVSYTLEREALRFLPDWLDRPSSTRVLSGVALLGSWLVLFTCVISLLDSRSTRRSRESKSIWRNDEESGA